jgi:hypothetical protein
MNGWAISGSYLEACNCEATCPCRRVGGVPGGRSSYGECLGALSWRILEGADGDLDLAGLNVVITSRYHDDEPRSPWRYMLYLDERATPDQRDSLEAIYTGKRAGSPSDHFPWAWKPSDLLGVESVAIEIDHTPRRGWFRAGGNVTVRIERAAPQQLPVTCVIPGHDRTGTEVIADVLAVSDGVAQYEVRGRCGYEGSFSYSGS